MLSFRSSTNVLFAVAAAAVATLSLVNGYNKLENDTLLLLDNLGTPNVSNPINITIDINSCLPTMTRASCIENCGKMLSQPPALIYGNSSHSFEVQTSNSLSNITYCQSHYYLLDGNCIYDFEDAANSAIYSMTISWFYETTGNSGFNLLYNTNFNVTDPTLRSLNYKDITTNKQLICWWVYQNTTSNPTQCAEATNDANCSPQ